MGKITTEQVESLRRQLERAWDRDTAHERYRGQAGAYVSAGQCYVSALVAFLVLKDHSPKIIRGDAGRGDNDHYWLEIDDHILDLTADQFGESNLPSVVWGTYGDYPNYRPLKEDTGFARFLRLLRRCNMEHLLHTGRVEPSAVGDTVSER